MKKLFVLDQKNYEDGLTEKTVYTVRAVIKRAGRLAMQQDARGEYKIPGGGVEADESYEEALVREVREETGLCVKTDSIREIGEVEEIRRDIFDENVKFHRHTFFYSCEVTDEEYPLRMTQSETAKGFHLAWATPQEIYTMNQSIDKEVWDLRDTEFIRMLAETV